MKKVKSVCFILVIIVCMLMSGCMGQQNGDDQLKVNKLDYADPVYDTNMDYQYFYRCGSRTNLVTVSDKGYYCSGTCGMILFVDKNTMKGTPLCNKINCNHDDPDTCNAYLVSFDSPFDSFVLNSQNHLQFYNHKLYFLTQVTNSETVSDDVFLSCVDEDGSKKKSFSEKINKESPIVDWLIHRDYFYCVDDHSIVRRPLSNFKDEEIIYELEEYDKAKNNIQDITAYGDYLYFRMLPSSENPNYELFGINLKTDSVFTLEDEDNDSIAIEGFVNGRILLFKGSKKDARAMTASLDLKDIQEKLTLPWATHLMCDGNYIYTDNSLRITIPVVPDGKDDERPKEYAGQFFDVYDLDFNKVDSFEIPSNAVLLNTTSDDPNNFIFYINSEEETVDKNSVFIYSLDKTQIGSLNGKPAEITKLCKTDWSRVSKSNNLEME